MRERYNPAELFDNTDSLALEYPVRLKVLGALLHFALVLFKDYYIKRLFALIHTFVSSHARVSGASY